MALQLIYGRSHSGKTSFILEKAKSLYKSGEPFVIVVPEQFTHLAEKKLLNKIGVIEQDRAEVISFERMATRINSRFSMSKKKLGSVAKSLIMSEIIQNADFSYYKNVSSESGFVESCINEISEFKKYKLSCDDIISVSKNVDDKALSLKLSDLANIFESYEHAIGTVYADADDSLGILCDNLYKYKPFEGFNIIFDEFSSFNPRERQIISLLCAQSKMTYITLCCDFSQKSKFLFKPVTDMGVSIIKACSENNCQILEPVTLEGAYYECDEMAFLEKNIYSFPCDVYNSAPKNIRIYVSETPYDEVKNLAHQIKSLVSKRNMRYRDIGIVCTDIGAYSHIFRSVFSEFGIPYFIDEKTDVLNHSVVCYILNIFDVYLHGYTSEYVTNHLKSGHINTDRNSVISVDKFVRETNISKNGWLDDEKWNKLTDEYHSRSMEDISLLNNIRNKCILPLASLHEQIKGRNTVRYITEKLYEYLVSSEFDNNVLGYIKYFKTCNNTYMTKQYEAVWNVLIETLDTLVRILGDKTVNIGEYRAYLYTAFGQQKIGVIPTSLDAVTVGDIKRSKSGETLYQFIVGAYDGSFPVVSKNSSVISDADKVKIANLGIELSPDTKNKAMFERYLTYLSLTHSLRTLVISYPMSDSSFSPVRPSFVITLIKNIFPELSENIKNEIFSDCNIASENSAMEFLASSAQLLSDGISADKRWQDVYAYLKDNQKHDMIDLIDAAVIQHEPVYKLDADLTDAMFKNEFYSTISRIQRYNSCRYSYYLEYMLGLEENKSYGPQSTDIGTFVHSVIEKVFIKMNKDAVNISEADVGYFKKISEPIFEECFPLLYKFANEITGREKYRLDSLKETVINALLNIKSHFAGSSFKPIGHEITFDDENVGCIELELDSGKKLKLTGKIDRADSFENDDGVFVRVIDYKTGNKIFNLSDVYYGLDIQLIVYLNTLVKNTEHAHHAGALYFKIQNPLADFQSHPQDDEISKSLLKLNAMTGIVADDSNVISAYSKNSIKSSKKASFAQFSKLSEYVESGIIKSASDMAHGYIQINPYSKSNTSPCAYCGYKSICGFREGKTGEFRKMSTTNDKTIWENILSIQQGGDDK